MSQYTDLFERAGERFELPTLPFEDVLRRRDRKRRSERIRAGVLAAVIAVSALGLVVHALRASHEDVPADRITPENVGNLGLAWKSDVSGASSGAVVADHHVYVAGDGFVAAYDEGCGSDGATCSPRWTDRFPTGGTQLVSDRMVYTSYPGGISAYPIDCGKAGSQCAPTWTHHYGSRSDAYAAERVINLSDGTLFVDYAVGAQCSRSCGHRVDVLDARSGHPLWARVFSPAFRGHIVANGKVYVLSGGVISAFTRSCSAQGGTCDPLWSWRLGNLWANADILEAGDAIVAGLGTYVYAFDESCRSRCAPVWRGEVACHGCAAALLYADGVLFASGVGLHSVHTFPASCWTESGGTCAVGRPDPTNAPLVENGVVSDGVLYNALTCDGCDPPGTTFPSGGIASAYDESCVTSGSACQPLWTSGGLFTDVATAPPVPADGILAVTAGGTLYVFAPGERPAAGPDAKGASGLQPIVWLFVLVVLVSTFASSLVRRRRRGQKAPSS